MWNRTAGCFLILSTVGLLSACESGEEAAAAMSDAAAGVDGDAAPGTDGADGTDGGETDATDGGGTDATDAAGTDATDQAGTDSTDSVNTDGTDSTDSASTDGSDSTDGAGTDGTDAGGTDGTDQGGTDSTDAVEPPPVQATYHTFIGDWTMTPGKEATKCVVKRLTNEEAVWVTAIHTALGAGSHHLIVYKSDEEEEILDPQNCTPFTETLGGDTIPLMITQIPEETLTFPPGVAFKFEPGQMIRIEAHYLNYYPNDITAHADVSFDTIDKADVVAEANMLFYGTPDFKLPPGQAYQTPWHFLDVWEGSKVFAITGHTHAYGTNVEVRYATGKDDEGEEVYPLDKPFSWEEAPVQVFDPPLEFNAGQGFRYRCSWFNDSDHTVGFGESANKEMCFFWAYYYRTPSKGYRMCVNPGNIYQGLGDQICCPDSIVCGLIKSYLAGELQLP